MYYHQESPNYVGLKYDGDRVQYKYAVNPYCVEETYPEGRAAISSKTTFFCAELVAHSQCRRHYHSHYQSG